MIYSIDYAKTPIIITIFSNLFSRIVNKRSVYSVFIIDIALLISFALKYGGISPPNKKKTLK